MRIRIAERISVRINSERLFRGAFQDLAGRQFGQFQMGVEPLMSLLGDAVHQNAVGRNDPVIILIGIRQQNFIGLFQVGNAVRFFGQLPGV